MADLRELIKRGDRERLAAVVAKARGRPSSLRSEDHLLHVAWQVSRQLIPWLLDQGVGPDQRDTVGGTVLMYAAADDVVELVDLLIGRGADVNARNESGETAFSYACANDSFRSAKLLHAAGADVNTVDDGGGSPLDWALNYASKPFFDWLVGVGCRHVDVGREQG